MIGAYSGSKVLEHVDFSDNESPLGGVMGSHNIETDYMQWDYATLVNNVAYNRGGAIEFAGTSIAFYHARFERNTAGTRSTSEGQGGAIHMYDSAILTVGFAQFTSNVANKGGAINMIAGCMSVISHSNFVSNRAVGNGGAIAVTLANVDLGSCTFWDNVAWSSLGAAAHADRPSSIKVVNTTFQPYEEGAATVFIGGRLGGCAEHPCDPGFSCGYERYSIACAPCQEGTYSSTGKTCDTCPSGKDTTGNQQGCTGCSGNDYSDYGVCQSCVGHASADHSICEPCPYGQIPKPDLTGCQCELGTPPNSEDLPA